MQNSDINTKKHDNNFTGVNFTSNPINTIPQSIQTAPNFRAEFVSKDEQKKYTTLLNMTDKNSRKNLEVLFKKGVLLNSDSNDSSSVLDNLYKIATTERARGLSNLSLLSDTINTLANPFIITQQFGDIPSEYRDQALKAYCADNQSNLLTQALAEQEIEHLHMPQSFADVLFFLGFLHSHNRQDGFLHQGGYLSRIYVACVICPAQKQHRNTGLAQFLKEFIYPFICYDFVAGEIAGAKMIIYHFAYKLLIIGRKF